MSDDIRKLAYRWHRIKSFRFVPGMAVVHEETGERARLIEVVYLGEKYPNEYDEYDICAEAAIIEGPEGGGNLECVQPADMWSWIPDLSDPATVGLLEHQVLVLYGGDQFSIRTGTGLKMNGEQTFWWRVKDLRGASLASGNVVLVGTDHAKIACLVDALERYEENRNE